MKIKQIQDDSVTPVTITLEYQEEIDQLFALLNFAPIGSVFKIRTNGWGELYRYLSDHYDTSGYNKWHDRLNDVFTGKNL